MDTAALRRWAADEARNLALRLVHSRERLGQLRAAGAAARAREAALEQETAAAQVEAEQRVAALREELSTAEAARLRAEENAAGLRVQLGTAQEALARSEGALRAAESEHQATALAADARVARLEGETAAAAETQRQARQQAEANLAELRARVLSLEGERVASFARKQIDAEKLQALRTAGDAAQAELARRAELLEERAEQLREAAALQGRVEAAREDAESAAAALRAQIHVLSAGTAAAEEELHTLRTALNTARLAAERDAQTAAAFGEALSAARAAAAAAEARTVRWTDPIEKAYVASFIVNYLDRSNSERVRAELLATLARLLGFSPEDCRRVGLSAAP